MQYAPDTVLQRTNKVVPAKTTFFEEASKVFTKSKKFLQTEKHHKRTLQITVSTNRESKSTEAMYWWYSVKAEQSVMSAFEE